MKSFLAVVGILVTFVAGAALLDEHVAGWDGFLPVGNVTVTASDNPASSRYAVDTAPETVWMGPRGIGHVFEATFSSPRVLTGVWTDNGNNFRLTPAVRFLRLRLTPAPSDPRFMTSAMRIFSHWSLFAFAPREVTRIQIECTQPATVAKDSWALRELRFLARGTFHFDAAAWLPALRRLPLPAAVAGAWCLLLGWLARRAAARSAAPRS